MTVLEEPIKEALTLRNYINGEWVASKGELVDVVNPATSKTIAKVPMSTRDELNEAVEAAKEAFLEWRRTPPLARARCLFRLRELLEKNFEVINMNSNMVEFFGKPISVFTEQNALDDGILMKNPSEAFPECDLITTNLYAYIEGIAKKCPYYETLSLLDKLMEYAKESYDNKKFEGDNDKNFFVVKLILSKAVWFVRNEYSTLTALLPSDY